MPKEAPDGAFYPPYLLVPWSRVCLESRLALVRENVGTGSGMLGLGEGHITTRLHALFSRRFLLT